MLSVRTTPDKECAAANVTGVQFRSQTQNILSAIQIASHHQHPTRILGGQSVEIRQKITLSGSALNQLSSE